VLKWQLLATAALSLAAAIPWGIHGAASAALGGLVNVTAGWLYGWWVTRRKAPTAGDAILTMLRAEGFKILLLVVQIGLVLAYYRDIVAGGFLIAFVVTVLVSTAAIAVKDA
jgi:ATP synthase protein I